MDLLNTTSTEFFVKARPDRKLLEDVRLISNMLAHEVHYMPERNYLTDSSQPEIRPDMRKILTTWMAEVCDVQACEGSVMPLATNILDRFLCTDARIHKDNLQLLGSVCLLIASKLRQGYSLTAEVLVYYTDNSATLNDMITWELLVLKKLNWDISPATAFDFVNPLLYRIPEISRYIKIRQHTSIFITLCSTEIQFSMIRPAVVAVASICVAAMGLEVRKETMNISRCILQKLTNSSSEEVQFCMDSIDDLFRSSMAIIHQASNNSSKRVASHTSTKTTQGSQPEELALSEELAQPETPTDVQDIHP